MRVDVPSTTFEPISEDKASNEGIQSGKGGYATRISKGLGQVACLAVLALASYHLVSSYLLQSVRVVGSSMVPALHDSESYLLNRWIFLFRDPEPADVVVLKDPSDGGFSVKRVVAVAGDTVQIKNGCLLVNGKEVHESYLKPSTMTYTDGNNALYRCGKDEYFLLGDNRNNSVDSRKYGPVPRKNILGLIIR